MRAGTDIARAAQTLVCAALLQILHPASEGYAATVALFSDATWRSGDLRNFLHAGFLGAYRTAALAPIWPNPAGLNYIPPKFPEAMGSGACWLDYDEDGWPDLYLVNGQYVSEPDKQTAIRPRSHLYRNRGDGTFTDVTEAAGVGNEGGLGMGCVVGDYDNDGRVDLYVLNYGQSDVPGPNRLYHNNGDGTFTDRAAAAGVDDPFHWGASGTFFDYDRDGCVDLYVSNYAVYDINHPGGNGPNSPGVDGQPNVLFHNNCDGSGKFTDTTAVAGVAGLVNRYHDGSPLTYGHSWLAVAGDYNNDGWPDLFVLNDEDPKTLYRNNGDGRFTDVSASACVADNRDDPGALGCITGNPRRRGPGRGSMGSDWGDLDGDGFLDTASVHYMNECAALYTSCGGVKFDDIGGPSGQLKETCALVSWGTLFFDYDNDGALDILIANSHTELYDARIYQRYETGLPTLLYHNEGSRSFKQMTSTATPALTRSIVGRGAAYADYDRDGALDVIIAVGGENTPVLLHNEVGAAANRIDVELAGAKTPDPGSAGANRSGIGARVDVEYLDAANVPHHQFRELQAGTSHMSMNELRLHFGLGSATAISALTVTWPSSPTLRTPQSFANLPANVAVRIREASENTDCRGAAATCSPNLSVLSH